MYRSKHSDLEILSCGIYPALYPIIIHFSKQSLMSCARVADVGGRYFTLAAISSNFSFNKSP